MSLFHIYSYHADNKIKAKTFICDLSENDIDGGELGNFTFIGKKVLKRLLREVHSYSLLLNTLTLLFMTNTYRDQEILKKGMKRILQMLMVNII